MPFNVIQQTMPDGSVTGGPVVPTPTAPLLLNTYSSLNSSDTYICNFETSRQLTLSGLSGVTLTTVAEKTADHGMVASPEDSLTAFTASVDGSKSGTLYSSRNVIKK